MAKMNIDPDGMARQSNQISSIAGEISTCVNNAFTGIRSLSSNWTGKAYNDLVTEINKTVQSLNNLFLKTRDTIPAEIYGKAVALAHANHDELSVSRKVGTVVIIKEIVPIKKGKRYTFDEDAIKSTATSIANSLKNAISKSDDAIKQCSRLKEDWDSVSGDENIYNLIAAFKKVKSNMETIRLNISNAIVETSAAMVIQDTTTKVVEGAKDVAGAVTGAVGEAFDSINSAFTDISRTAQADNWADHL